MKTKKSTEELVRTIVEERPDLIEIKRTNDLIREIWKRKSPNISAMNIYKIAGILRTERRLKMNNDR